MWGLSALRLLSVTVLVSSSTPNRLRFNFLSRSRSDNPISSFPTSNFLTHR
ncbi:hypothetical protein LINGRAHAP2_LOCUS28756 [Linum grandiflorum]